MEMITLLPQVKVASREAWDKDSKDTSLLRKTNVESNGHSSLSHMDFIVLPSNSPRIMYHKVLLYEMDHETMIRLLLP